MTDALHNEVVAGTYMDPDGRTHKVLEIAQHRQTGVRTVIYIPSYGEKAGQLLAEDVGVYIDLFVRPGRFKYQGPHPRVLGTNRPSPALFARKEKAR